MENFFLSLKIGTTSQQHLKDSDEAGADVSDYIERCRNAKGRRATIGYLGPVGYE
jgi:hypothetical protein